MKTLEVRDYHSRIILGTIEVDCEGNKTVRNFSGQVLGRYDASRDITEDFYGIPLYIGDMSAAFLK